MASPCESLNLLLLPCWSRATLRNMPPDYEAWEAQQKAQKRHQAQAQLAEFNEQRQQELEARRQQRAAEEAERAALAAAAAPARAPAPSALGGMQALLQGINPQELLAANPALLSALQGALAPAGAASAAAVSSDLAVRVCEAGEESFRRVVLGGDRSFKEVEARVAAKFASKRGPDGAEAHRGFGSSELRASKAPIPWPEPREAGDFSGKFSMYRRPISGLPSGPVPVWEEDLLEGWTEVRLRSVVREDVKEFIELLSDEEEDTEQELRREWQVSCVKRPSVEPLAGKYLSGLCKLVIRKPAPPSLSLLAGDWRDSMGNLVKVSCRGVDLLDSDGRSARPLPISTDRWGRLWCGTYVLHEAGYEGTSRAKAANDSPCCLAWRTTRWQHLGSPGLLEGV
ncbi:unnamed protein product [Effrenium voratum]|nr:unnamed protein product [Effrenium voratum]